MGNEKEAIKPDYLTELSESEKNDFESFITVMVQVIEKYGKFVLQRLDSVA